MAFIRKSGSSKMYSFLKKASTVFALGDACTLDGSGLLIPAVAGSTSIVGVIKRAVVATDADYAQSVPVPVELMLSGDTFEVDASTTVTQAMAGTARDIVTNAGTLNVGASGTTNQFRILGIGSTATKAIVSCIKSAFTV